MSTTSSQADPDRKALTCALQRVIRTLTMQPPRSLVVAGAVVTGKLVALAVAAVVFAIVSIFGFASTGTPIGSLTGAAAASATYYWIGSLLGFGAVGGATMLSAGSLAAGAAAGARLRRAAFTPRSIDNLSDREAAVLVAAIRLQSACRATASSKHERAGLRVLAGVTLGPFSAELHALAREASRREDQTKWDLFARSWRYRNLQRAAEEVDDVMLLLNQYPPSEVRPSSWRSRFKGLRALIRKIGHQKRRWSSTP